MLRRFTRSGRSWHSVALKEQRFRMKALRDPLVCNLQEEVRIQKTHMFSGIRHSRFSRTDHDGSMARTGEESSEEAFSRHNGTDNEARNMGTKEDEILNRSSKGMGKKLAGDFLKVGKAEEATMLVNLVKTEDEIPVSIVQAMFKLYSMEEALEIFFSMLKDRLKFDSKSYAVVIEKLCISNRIDSAIDLLENMKKLHGPDIVPCNTIVRHLVSAGRVEEALGFLKEVVETDNLAPSCLTYCVFVEELVKRRRFDEAYTIYQEAVDNGEVSKIASVYRFIFNGLLGERRHEEALEIFGRYLDVGGVPTSSMFIGGITSLCKLGMFEEAVELFESTTLREVMIAGDMLVRELSVAGKPEMCVRVVKHLLGNKQLKSQHLVNATIDCLCKSDMIDKAYSWFQDLRKHGLINVITYNILINALCKRRSLDEGVTLFEEMKTSARISPTLSTYNTLISGLCKGDRVNEASQLFKSLLDSGMRVNIITYNTIIDGLCKANRIAEAVELLDKVVSQGGVLTSHPYNSIIDALFKMDRPYDAEAFFDRMALKDRVVPHEVTYAILVDGFCKSNKVDRAKEIFSKFVGDGGSPSVYMCSALMDGLCKTRNLEEGYRIFELMTSRGLVLNNVMNNIFLNSLFRSNRISQAKDVFEKMVERQKKPDVVTYGTVIDGFCKAKRIDEARKVMELLVKKGGKPDVVTFTSFIAGLCNMGRLEEAREVVEVEMRAIGCSPNVFTCNILVNAYGVAGRIHEAQELLQKFLEMGIEPNELTFSTMTKNLAKSQGWDSYSWSEWRASKPP